MKRSGLRSEVVSTVTTFATCKVVAVCTAPALFYDRLLAAGFLLYLFLFLIKLVERIGVRGENGKLFCGFWSVGRFCANRKCA